MQNSIKGDLYQFDKTVSPMGWVELNSMKISFQQRIIRRRFQQYFYSSFLQENIIPIEDSKKKVLTLFLLLFLQRKYHFNRGYQKGKF